MPNMAEVIAKRRTSKSQAGADVYIADAATADFRRLPTGIFSLDYILAGGFPVGVTSSVYGPPGGGKTLIVTKLMASAQSLCWNCFKYLWDCECGDTKERKAVLVDLETFDPLFAAQCGLNVDELVLARPDYGEQAVDICIEAMKADDVGIVVLDSLAMLTPIKEIEASCEEESIALQARLISKMIRKLKPTLIKERKRGHTVAFVATNQIRSKIGVVFGNPEEIPGGHTSKHDWHLMFRMSQVKSKDVTEDGMVNIGEFRASLAAMGNKRKILTLGGSAEFKVCLNNHAEIPMGSVDDISVSMKYAQASGYVKQEGSWLCGTRQFDKKIDIVDTWKSDPEYYLSTKRSIIDQYIRSELGNG